MSGGQQQRVSIARSLVSNPKIIFADEPTGNLDSKTTIEILEFMQEIVRTEHKTLIMVSHDAEVAMYAGALCTCWMEGSPVLRKEQKILQS